MSEETSIFLILAIVGLLIILLLTLSYILPIIFIRRFHTVNNILTGNVCLAAILCSSFWIIYYILFVFYPMELIKSAIFCSLLPYFETMFNCLIIYALAVITINRFFTIRYPNKRMFKKQSWSFISSLGQWLTAIILPLPNVVFLSQVNACINYSAMALWLRFYNFFIVVILPSIINGFFNARIFFLVRSSTRRVHALTTNVSSNVNSCHLNTRDIYLLKHMLFIFIIFVSGWISIYIVTVIATNGTDLYMVYLFLQLLPELSSFIAILDLFWYNHDLRNYLKEQFLNCLQFCYNWFK